MIQDTISVCTNIQHESQGLSTENNNVYKTIWKKKIDEKYICCLFLRYEISIE